VYNSWNETGFAWEQYNPDTGAGQRTQHFTGWTALVVKILALPDLDPEEIGVPPLDDSTVPEDFRKLHWGRRENEWSRADILIVVGLLMTAFIMRRKLKKIWRRAMR
jgi:mannosyl-oligosaccharide glucosidase